jgi:hypothetical protein
VCNSILEIHINVLIGERIPAISAPHALQGPVLCRHMSACVYCRYGLVILHVWPCFLVAVVRPASHAVRQKKFLAASLAPALAPFPAAAAAGTTGPAPSLATLPALPYPSTATAPAEPRSSSSPDPHIAFCLSQLRHCLPRCTSRVSLPASIVPPWLPIALALSQIRCSGALIGLYCFRAI